MTLSLADVQVPLALFAEAIVGHPVAIDVVDDASGSWPCLPTDPASQRVTLPAELATDDYRALLLHQLIVLEDRATGTAAERPRAPGHVDAGLFATVFAIVDDARIDAITRHRYPGAAVHLDDVLARVRAELAASGNLQLDLLRRYSLGDSSPDVGAELREPLDSVRRSDATAADSHAAAVQLCEIVQGVGVAHGSDDDAEPDASDVLDLGDDARGASLDTTATPAQVELSDAASGGQTAPEMPPEGVVQPDGEREPIGGLQLPSFAGSAGASVDRRTFVYDEWDYRASDHRRAWCRVVEEELEGDDHDFIADVRARHMALRSRIRRTFAQLRPEDLVRVYRRIDGEEVDIDGVIEAVVDRRTGAPADDRVHIRRDRAARDVATAFLVDLSASTSSPAVPPGPPEPFPDIDPLDDPLSYAPMYPEPGERGEPERRVIDVAKDSVALMSDALHELGDQHAIYGFSGKGRDEVEFKIAREFDDRVSPRSWASIAAMKPLQYTRMGPAVRHATTKLAAQPARTRLLIVVSDGYPQDIDYGEDARDRDYGVHDTARALSDAADLGIDTFCITIDPAGHDYLRQMCAPDRYLVIDDVESLPEELARVYLQLAT